jgi:hypothetical protein
VTPNPRLQRTRAARSPLSRQPLGGIKRLSGLMLALGTCVFGLSASSAQTISTQQGWLRSSVKELDEPTRSLLLSFLDEGRKRSDAIAATLVSGDRTSLASQITPEAMAGWEQVLRAIRELKATGARSDLTYRNQAVEDRTEGGRQRMTSRVWYVVGDPSSQLPRAFVAIVVVEEARHAGRAIAIEPLSYTGDVPTWLLKVDGPVMPPTARPPS